MFCVKSLNYGAVVKGYGDVRLDDVERRRSMEQETATSRCDQLRGSWRKEEKILGNFSSPESHGACNAKRDRTRPPSGRPPNNTLVLNCFLVFLFFSFFLFFFFSFSFTLFSYFSRHLLLCLLQQSSPFLLSLNFN